MRNAYLKLKQDGQNLLDAGEALKAQGDEVSEKEAKRRNTIIQENGVGEVQELGEFGLGIAPKGSKPINKIETSKAKEAEIADAQAYEPYTPSVAPALLDDETALLD